jgi:hypothetical protein
MLGYFMIDLSNSMTTGSRSDNAQPLSSPDHFPGDEDSTKSSTNVEKPCSEFSAKDIGWVVNAIALPFLI